METFIKNNRKKVIAKKLFFNAVCLLSSIVPATLASANQIPVLGQGSTTTQVNASELHSYDPQITDPDGDALTYTVETYPTVAGVTISSAGVVNWTPSRDDVGQRWITVRANDGNGGILAYEYNFNVIDPNNQLPVVGQQPAANFTVGGAYSYDPQITDPEGDAITYTVETYPTVDGVTISSTGVVIWTPTRDDVGKRWITIRANDAHGGILVFEYTLMVTDPSNLIPVINQQPVATANYGDTYSYNPQATDGDNDTLSYEVWTWPAVAGVSIDTGGNMSWTPTREEVGEYWVDVVVNDGHLGEVKNHFKLTIIDPNNQAPVIGQQPATTVNVGDTYIYDLQATDGDNDPMIYSVWSWPAPTGLNISTDGIVSWAPTRDDVGTLSMAVKADDGYLGVTTLEFELSVIDPSNQAPFFNSAPIAQATVGTAYPYTASATDADGDAITYALLISPTGMTIDASTGQLSWTPATQNLSPGERVKIEVSDNYGGSSRQDYYVVVSTGSGGSNTSPTINTQPPTSAQENTLYQATLDVTDAEGDPLTFTLVTFPAGMTVSTGGVIEWTPGFSDAGDHPVSLSITDGQGGIVSTSFTLSVANSNRVPVASDQSVSLQEDTVLAISLVASDADGEPLTYTIVSTTSHGTLSGSGASLSYIPDAHFNGSDSFTFRASDGIADSNLATVTLTVSSSNDVPQWQYSPAISAAENTAYSTTVLATDADGDTLSYNLTTAPDGMSIDSSTGVISWLPGFDQAGGHTVTVAVSDNNGGSVSDTFLVNVTNTNRPPQLITTALPSVIVGQPYSVLIQSSDSDGDALSYSLGTAPAGMSINAQTGALSWQPQTGQDGIQTVLVTVEDGNGGQVSNTLIVQVYSTAERLVVVDSFSATAFVDFTYSQKTQVIYDGTEAVSFSLDASPQGMTIAPDTGLIQWRPTIGQLGPHDITVEAQYGTETTSLTYSLNVIEASAMPSNLGSSFWLTAGYQYGGVADIQKVYVAGINSATLTVEKPGQPAYTVSLAQGEIVEIDISDQPVGANDQILLNATHIQSDADVAVYASSSNRPKGGDEDSYTVLPTHSLGMEYINNSFGAAASDRGQYLTIIATEDNTEVTVTLSNPGFSDIPFNDPLTLTLDRGESYKTQQLIRKGVDLTGSHVIANKPVAVVSWRRCHNIPWNSLYCDRTIEQLLPVALWGTEHYSVPIKTRYNGDYFRIVAAYDNTEIRINGVYVRSLQAREFYETYLDQASAIISTKPVSVAQFSTSANYDKASRELEPQYAALRRGDVIDTDGVTEADISIVPGTTENYVMVLTTLDGINQFQVDGQPIPENYFTTQEIESRQLAQIVLPPGQHHLSSSVPFAYAENVNASYNMADPFMVLLPSRQQYLDHYLFTVPKSGISRHFINVILPAEALGTLVLNDEVIDPAWFEPIPGTNLYSLQYGVNVGAYAISAAKPFALTVYGFGYYRTYGYIGGFGVGSKTPVASLVVDPVPSQALVAETVCLAMTATDASGEPVRRGSIQLAISGAHDSELNLFTDAEGKSRHCYTGNMTGLDDISLSADGVIQTFQLDWQLNPAVNVGPVVDSIPSTFIETNEQYTYQVQGQDAEGDTLSYALNNPPTGVEIDTQTGVLTWLPTSSGFYELELLVSDGMGNTTLQVFTLEVNAAPVIDSIFASTQVSIDQRFRGYIVAADEEGDAITYALVSPQGNANASVSPSTGNVSWSDFTLPGNYSMTVSATDEHGASSEFTANFTVFSYPPVFNQDFPVDVYTENGLSHTLIASDSDRNAVLTYQLIDGPPDLEVDPAGLMTWSPTITELGTHTVTVEVSDQYGETDRASFDLWVTAPGPEGWNRRICP